MRLLITGAKGMLGRTLMRCLCRHDCAGVDIEEMDITCVAAVDRMIGDLAPDAVIHCAAMTAVDDCESEVDRAWQVNAIGSGNVGAACGRRGIRLIAVSTDYVFAGDLDRPYHEWDAPAPKTVYGASKLAGEQAVRRHCPDHIIVRVAWLYGQGGPSFLHTMCRLGAEDGAPLKVVDDQIGNPTSVDAVANGIAELLGCPLAGTVHLTCEGRATWFTFAQAIFRLKRLTRKLIPCTTAEFPRPAPRPANSCLENRALRWQGLKAMPSWTEALETFCKEYPDG